MPFIEAPTTFYLGRRYDPDSKRLSSDVVYYDSRDLTTHAVVVGMTGSGKTGLCITLLEEAILDNIPSIIIDPKGDITNLLLTFPDLRPEDFQPWVNPDDARRAGMDIPQYSADVAHTWAQGLASWSIVPDRMRWLKFAARYSIYTPGSDAGLPISILASLRAPRDGWNANVEANREKINGIVTALLALVGRDAQPIQDKEHVLVSNIFEWAWQRGQDLTLEQIILQVQKPPFDKLGVFPIDDYISEKVRQKLAMDLNNIVAAPSFQSWLNGDPMDIQNLLYQPDGRPRVSIFYIAHLSESERQFIITLLLENMLGWMNTLSGTTSLRALLYIDEMFGYFPSYPYNPPTKQPILRLLKQARAFGLGMILATQNPGDLDYKGLSNAGTWFIGRLQSDNDKQRVMSGLEAMATVDNQMSMQDVGRLISDVPPRVFLMHNVNDQSGPVMVHTRWAMNYLRGPLTRQQVQTLMADQRAKLAARQPAAAAAQSAIAASVGNTGPGFAAQMVVAQQAAPAYNPPPPPPMNFPEAPPSLPEFPRTSAQPSTSLDYTSQIVPTNQQVAPVPPQLPGTRTPQPQPPTPSGIQAPPGYSELQPPVPASVAQYFLPNDVSSQQAIADWERKTNFSAASFGGATLAYRPFLMAQVSIRYQDRKTQLYTVRQAAYLVSNVERAGIVHWDQAEARPFDTRRLSGEPFATALYGDLDPGMTDSKRMTALQRELVDLVYNTKKLEVPYNAALNLYGNPDSDFASFRSQLQQTARERRDAEMDTLTAKYEKILDRFDDQIERKGQRLDNTKRTLADLKREQLFTTGEAVLGLMKGRTSFTLSRMSRSAVYKQRTKGQVDMAALDVQQLEENKADAVAEYENAVRDLNERWAKIATSIEQYQITPYKKDITVDLFGIGWVPFWYAVVNGQPLLLSALSGG
ncbi:MAG: DUF87 domain-containing protein [Chloroflexi bacterium]|nr:DUF87 domain-containing protein [Chloroflexota bacterium]